MRLHALYESKVSGEKCSRESSKCIDIAVCIRGYICVCVCANEIFSLTRFRSSFSRVQEKYRTYPSTYLVVYDSHVSQESHYEEDTKRTLKRFDWISAGSSAEGEVKRWKERIKMERENDQIVGA